MPRRLGLLAAAVLVVALALRVGLALEEEGRAPAGDAADYDRHALAIAEHGGYPSSGIAPGGGPTAFRPPGYPLLLGAVYAVSGTGEGRLTAGRLAGAVVGTVAVALVGVVALLLAGPAAALLAMALAAIHPPLVASSVALLSEGLFVTLLLAALACALWFRRRPDRLAWLAAAGALAGAAALTRTNGLVIVLAVALGAWTAASPRHRLLRLGVAAAFAALVILPWSVRNVLALDEPAPLTTQAGFTLAGAYNVGARRDDRFPAAWRPPDMPPYDRLLGAPHADESDLERAFRDEALGYAADHPAYVGRVVLWASARMANVVDAELLRLGARETGVREGWVVLDRVAFWLLAALALLGVVRGRLRRVPAFLLVTPVLLWLSVAVVIGSTRYRVPVDPFLIVAAALGLARR